MREIDKEKAYNTVALKYYELEELRKIKVNLITAEQDSKAEVTIKTIHSTPYNELLRFRTKKKSFDIAPKLLIQIIDGLIENKKEYLDKAIDLTVLAEKEGK